MAVTPRTADGLYRNSPFGLDQCEQAFVDFAGQGVFMWWVPPKLAYGTKLKWQSAGSTLASCIRRA